MHRYSDRRMSRSHPRDPRVFNQYPPKDDGCSGKVILCWVGAFLAAILAFGAGWWLAPSSTSAFKDDPILDSARKRTCLLIIDPQVDFAEGGSLAVAGAKADGTRLASWIQKQIGKIDNITVSLDSHQYLHVGNALFWHDKNGQHPAPFTPITNKDIQAGNFKAANPKHQKHVEKYTKELEENGRDAMRKAVMVWPDHCIMGTPGHAIQPELTPALEKWAKHHKQPVKYAFKGQNPLTECYSVFRAEVVLGDTPYEGGFNQALFDHVSSYDRIVVAGQAKSHCVNFSVRDLLEKLSPQKRKQVYLLEDCTHPVANPPGTTLFTDASDAFVKHMKGQGAKVTDTKLEL